MNLDIPTLAFVQCLIFLTQVLVLALQFALDRTSRGLGLWVTGSILMALGIILMPFVMVKSLLLLALFSNPLYVLGLFVLHRGVVRFLGRKPHTVRLSVLYMAFLLAYLGFLFLDNDLGPRTAVLNAAMAAISGLVAWALVTPRQKDITGSARFVALIFLVSACIDVVRLGLALTMPGHSDYQAQGAMLHFAFVYPTVLSTLWTFGFVIMLNQRLNARAIAEKEKLKQVFNTSPDAAFIARWSDGMVVDVNDGFVTMTGYTREGVIGRTDVIVRLWRQAADHGAFLSALGAKRQCSNQEFSFMTKAGDEFTGLISARIIDISGVAHLAGSVHDITALKQSAKRITELASQLEQERNAARKDSVTDSLTGLPNRRMFDQRLQAEFLRLKRSGVVLSLIMLDIDLFKQFNDAYGHQAGDECLRHIGTLFAGLAGRVSDLAARYGGEEFAFILPGTTREGAWTMAERIRASVEGLSIPLAAPGLSHHVTVSLGVASAPSAGLETPEQMVEVADEALYRAKKAGRNRIEVA